LKPDVVILGAGAAGLMCALRAGQRGLKVLIFEHNDRVGRKILISGGGRCNFTNLETSPKNYVSENPHFSKSALSRYTPSDFIALLETHGIAYHEKKLGQLFCDTSAREIVRMLETECARHDVEIRLSAHVRGVQRKQDGAFRIDIAHSDPVEAAKVVVATGGLSIPKIGASDIGYRIATHFSISVTKLSPALDGFTMRPSDLSFFSELSGLSVDCILSCRNGVSFRENLLFTHAGLSGPVALQGSLHWRPEETIHLNLLPDLDIEAWLMGEKSAGNRKLVKNLLAERLPSRFADAFCARYSPALGELCQAPDRMLRELSSRLSSWEISPLGTVGYSKAEVTRGGVDTSELSSKTLEAKKVPGLYFIGEVVDVTGWLGGYNFQWAWASGWAAANAL
jgi:predicted Rossmann fold flavoprotein